MCNKKTALSTNRYHPLKRTIINKNQYCKDLIFYSEKRNFLNAINKAKNSCNITGEAVSDHFVDVNKMV